jgi:hypothetical protein
MRLFRRAIPLALVFLSLASVGASAQGQKIGYIRSSVILDQAPVASRPRRSSTRRRRATATRSSG